jgi:HlyD family secretion protein
MKKDLTKLKIDRSRRPTGAGSKFWMILSLVLLAVVAYLGYERFVPKTTEDVVVVPADEKSVDVVSEPEESDNPREVLIASGYIVARHKHELGSKVMGRVAWIGVEKGDLVSKGQLLVKLEDREYRARLDQAKANLAANQTRLAELKAGSRPEEIEQGEAELRRAEADLENARLERERMERLYRDRLIPEHELDNARSRFKMAQSAVTAAKKSYELLQLGPRQERIEAARAAVSQAEASLSYAQTMLDATEIRAPVSGTVLRRIAEVGEMITTSFAGEMGAKSAVIALADLSDLQVELDISQADFNRISEGHGCQMSPEAYSDRVYPCQLDEIAPEADRRKASIQVKVRILNPDEFLRPEMSARVTFFEREGQDDQPASD